MISYEEALQHVFATVKPLIPRKYSLPDAAGLTLAETISARWDMPRCNNSAMDGFAIAAPPEDINKPLQIIGAAYAGHPFGGLVGPNEAIRITTGAPLPEGASTVIPMEDAVDHKTQVVLSEMPQFGQHIRPQGEEFLAGVILIEAGTPLYSGEIGLLACAGIEYVLAYPKPRVAILSTGDELVELGKPLGHGQIINSSLYLLMTRLRECGCSPIPLGIGQDDPDSLDSYIKEGMEADLLISTGGVSVGERDQMHTTLSNLGFQQKFWKVAIKPGKPVLFGTLGEKPYFGLPGNPAATAATFELFVKPALSCLSGRGKVPPTKRTGILTTEVKGGGKRQAFLWCRVEWTGGGYQVSVPQRQGSGQHRSLQGANALLSIAVGTERLLPGEDVEVFLLGGESL